MRVLIVTNLTPDAGNPQRGRWVADQVEGIRAHGVEVEMFGFATGRREYLPATRKLRLRLRDERFDLVHAHYGLAAWCARLAGADPLVVTFHGTDVHHRVVGPLSRRLARRIALCAAVSRSLFAYGPGGAGLPRDATRNAVLPCGPDLRRFSRLPRDKARRELGLEPDRPYLLFPADPGRPAKRHDRAAEIAAAAGAELLTGGAIEPERMPLWVNAANAVLVTSDYEGFGLAAVEALACDVPVLSTPVGIAPHLLAGIEGCLAAPFAPGPWLDALRPHLAAADPRVAGRARAATLSAERMAERVVIAYRDLLSATSQ